MTVIVDISIPAEEFALGHLLEVRPGVRVRLETMIPTSGSPIPYFWVKRPDAEAVTMAFQESPIVNEVSLIDEVEDETLFRVDWSEDIDGVIDAITEANAVVLSGNGLGDHWSFKLRFPDSDSLSSFYQNVIDDDIAITLDSVHNPTDGSTSSEYGLTAEQREALQIAFEQGYFAVPREVTLVDLAQMLDISDSAVSQRIRRGVAKLLSATLFREMADR